MKLSWTVTCHCDRCPATSIGRYTVRKLPGGDVRLEHLEVPAGWGQITIGPPAIRVASVERRDPSALMSAAELARMANAPLAGLGCRKCVLELQREQRPLSDG